jgi:hypothetical protein
MENNSEQDVHPDYLKGFNEGYLLHQHNPQLATDLAKAMEAITSERASGFKAGSHEYAQEKEKDFTISWLQPLPDHFDDISPEQDMEKDDPDLEIE